MKIESIKQQNSSYRGDISKLTGWVADHPGVVASLAGASVVAQKAIQSTAEVAFAPNIDIWIGKGITKATGEEDGRTNQSSKVQAVRTVSQTVGGSITGIIIRLLCVGGMTALLVKTGGKVGEDIAKIGKKAEDQNSNYLNSISEHQKQFKDIKEENENLKNEMEKFQKLLVKQMVILIERIRNI